MAEIGRKKGNLSLTGLKAQPMMPITHLPEKAEH